MAEARGRVVLTYGTFDIFHIGHVRLLQRARQLGDRLIVGCSTDEFNAGKGKKAIFPYEHRRAILESCRHVDEVIPETSWDQKAEDVRRHGVDVFAMGDDWAGKFDFLQDQVQVVYLPRTEGISTTEVKAVIGAIQQEHRRQILNAAEHLMTLLQRA
jgi:glycerol-3-phosphate cytidylyltransferase